MKRLLAAVVSLAVVLTTPAPVVAQGNDDDYTPLNSRIKRSRQFPLSLPAAYDPRRMTDLMRDRSKNMASQFARCVYNRSSTQSLSLLQRTDVGFNDFRQIDVDPSRAARIYGFQDCLKRVATSNNTGVQMRLSPGALRQWLIQESYVSSYPDGPSWVQPGIYIAERSFPISEGNPGVVGVMDFADCVVQADPYNADYFFRAVADSPDEKEAIDKLMPTLGPCLPQGARVEMDSVTLRVYLGEALWHAANNNSTTPPADLGEAAVPSREVGQVRQASAPAAGAAPLTDTALLVDLQRIAGCIVDKNRDEAVAMLLNPEMATRSDGTFNALMQNNLNCLNRPTNIERMVMAGFIAEDLLRKNGISIAGKMPAEFTVTSLPLCVAERDDAVPGVVDSLVGAAPGSAEEAAAVEALRSAWSLCAPDAPFQPALARGVMTSGLFPLVWNRS